MQNSPPLLRILGILTIASTFICAGCSSLIAYCGKDVERLKDKQQVRDSFGTPDKVGTEKGQEFEEFHTWRKISEPRVAGINFILGTETLGLFELWMFPAGVIEGTWGALFGLTLRFEYAENGEVQQVLINGTPMNSRGADLP